MKSAVSAVAPSSVKSMVSSVTGTPSTNSGISVTGTIAGATTAAKNAQADAKSALTYVPYVLGGLIVLLAVILIPLYFLGYLTPKKANKGAPAAIAGANQGFQSGPTTEGFQTAVMPPPSIDPNDETLVNVQPLSIKDLGFQGPYPDGVFDAAGATAGALKAGFRFLTLQIDFMDTAKDASKYAAALTPTLLIRSASGALLSSNSGSIEEVAQAIANIGFNPTVPNSTRPIILYLHINRTPVTSLADPNAYLSFLSKIATALAPLTPYHLGLTPLGNFTRQKMEGPLLTTPLKSLEGQVVVLSNADTSLFRSTSPSIQKYDPSDDLDFWVNMRVYLDSPDDTFGVTQLPTPSSSPSAVVVDMTRIMSLSSNNQKVFANQSPYRFVIAMGPRSTNPTPAAIGTAINILGVNSIPIDIFTDTTEDILAITGQYSNLSFRPKPVALHNITQ